MEAADGQRVEAAMRYAMRQCYFRRVAFYAARLRLSRRATAADGQGRWVRGGCKAIRAHERGIAVMLCATG